MEQDPIENIPLEMSRTIHSRQAGACNKRVYFCFMAKDHRNALKFIEQAEANGVTLNTKVRQAVPQLPKK